MPHAQRPARSTVARALAGAACACAALVLASCGKDTKSTAPIVGPPGPPGPMITLTGDPNVSVNMLAYVSRTVADDTLSGYFYLTLSDSSSRYTYVTGVTLNGVAMRLETTTGGAPFRYVLRPYDLGPAYRPADLLHFAVTDTSGLTAPFAFTVAPAAFDLPPDSTELSQRNDYTVHWSGGPDLVALTLTDFAAVKVSARLQFINETGLSELLIRAQDLQVLTPGAIQVGSIITEGETFVATRHPRRMTAAMSISDARAWRLMP